MSIFDPAYIDHQIDTKVSQLVLNRLDKEKFDELSSHSSDEIWFIQDSELSGQPIVVDTRPVEMPTKLSEFQNDVPYLSAVSWSQVTGKPTIPSYTSQLTNDSGYATSAYVQQQVLQSSTKLRDWYSEPPPMLTFTAEEANSTIAIYKEGNPPDVSLEYSVNGGTTWNDFIVGTTTVTLTNVGDQMMLRAKTTNATFATDTSNENRFIMTGKIAATGSIMYLLRNDGDSDTVPDYGFPHLFVDCAALTSPPDIPATKLGRNCYEGMLQETSISAIEIPEAELNQQCYYWMFAACHQLREIKIHYTGNFQGEGVPYEAFSYWVYNVSSSGTFYYNGSDTSQSESAIPYGWTVQTF